ncbi:hypothetical protein B296_00025178, partial [Ensete ventricosum]
MKKGSRKPAWKKGCRRPAWKTGRRRPERRTPTGSQTFLLLRGVTLPSAGRSFARGCDGSIVGF